MDIEALKTATLKCLAAHDQHYKDANITATTPIAGGYSRFNHRLDIDTNAGKESVVLQYSPAGATGLVRVDRHIENDLLGYLSNTSQINSASLITSDLEQQFFDSTAYLFKAEPGRPYVEVCRETEETDYPKLNRTIAGVCAQVHSLDINSLPASMPRPASWKDYLDEQIEYFKEVESSSRHSRPFLRYFSRWLDDNRPPEAPLSVVHGDFQISNMLAVPDDDASAVIVDWELAHVGDPREDLGWFTMVCGTIPPNTLAADPNSFYDEYRKLTGLSKHIINPATSAYFLIISSIRTHYGMMKSSDALAESAEQAQSALAAYYMDITTYQHMNWMNSIALVESLKESQA